MTHVVISGLVLVHPSFSRLCGLVNPPVKSDLILGLSFSFQIQINTEAHLKVKTGFNSLNCNRVISAAVLGLTKTCHLRDDLGNHENKALGGQHDYKYLAG